MIKYKGEGWIALFGFVFFYIVISAVHGIGWWYGLNTFLFIFGKFTIVPYWKAFLLGGIPYLGSFGIPLAAIAFIAILFV